MKATVVWLLFFIILSLRPFLKLLYTMSQLLLNSKQINLKQKFGSWAVITGSTDGIGKEYAKELAKRDIDIVLISRSTDRLEATKQEINSVNPKVQVKIIQADFSKSKDAIEKIDRELKDIPVGILVNNVGKITDCPMYFGECSREVLSDIININIGATTLMTHLVIEKMRKLKRGAIVNVSSLSDATPVPLMAVYGASKTFIRYFSDAIRAEYSNCGITVQTLSPCFVDTKIVNFFDTVKRRPIVYPDAATYAKNAVNTLGKLNSTAGYWIHDILYFTVCIAPSWYALRHCLHYFGKMRNDYLKSHKRND